MVALQYCVLTMFFIDNDRECLIDIQPGKFTSAKWRSVPWRTATSTANSTSNFAGKSKSRYDKLTTTAGKLFSLQVNYYASVVLNDTALPKSYLLLLGNSITHSLSHSTLKTFFFCKSFLPQPFLFLLRDSLHGFLRLFSVISEHICFLVLVLLFLNFLVVGSVP